MNCKLIGKIWAQLYIHCFLMTEKMDKGKAELRIIAIIQFKKKKKFKNVKNRANFEKYIYKNTIKSSGEN